MVQHEIMTGVVPVTAPRQAPAARQSACRTRREPLSYSSRRLTGGTVLLGLLGAALAALVLVDGSSGQSVARADGSGRRAGGLPRLGQTASSRAGLRLLARPLPRAGHLLPGRADCGLVGAARRDYLGRPGLARTRPQHPGAGHTWAQRRQPPRRRPRAAAAQEPDGILGLSQQLLVLMPDNYQVVYAAGARRTTGRRGSSMCCAGTAAWPHVLAGYRDEAATAPGDLRLPGAHISEDAFINLRIGDSGLRGMPVRPCGAGQPGWIRCRLPGSGTGLAGAEAAAGRSASHRRAPERHRGGPVIDLDYSDGLSLVSSSCSEGSCRGDARWQEITLRGSAVYSTDPGSRSLVWSARGFVYTVIAEAPRRRSISRRRAAARRGARVLGPDRERHAAAGLLG